MSEQNKRVARRVLVELFEKGKLEATEELIDRDFVNHEAPPGNPRDRRASSRQSRGCTAFGARCGPTSKT